MNSLLINILKVNKGCYLPSSYAPHTKTKTYFELQDNTVYLFSVGERIQEWAFNSRQRQTYLLFETSLSTELSSRPARPMWDFVSKTEGREMALLRALTALLEDLGLIYSFHIVVATFCNSSSRGIEASSLSRQQHLSAHTHIHMYT